MPQASLTVLVTGGSGFLGRELIRQLATCDEVDKIVSLDIRPAPLVLGLRQELVSKKIKFVESDICQLDQLNEHFAGVDCVIHAAAKIELGVYPDVKAMTEVNVQGTANVLEACRTCKVPNLVFTSTSEMARSFEPIENFNEDEIDKAAEEATVSLLAYSGTKRQAEQLVLAANSDGVAGPKTLAIRPSGIYGEGDEKFIPTILRVGKQCMGIMPHLGSQSARIQRVYVGNVAWAHICAMRSLVNGENVNGEAYTVTDDTQLCTHFQFAEPFMRERGIRLIRVTIPLLLVFVLFRIIEFLLLRPLEPLVKLPIPFSSNEIYMACVTCYYNGDKIRDRLKYKPKFNADESMRRSHQYYCNMQL